MTIYGNYITKRHRSPVYAAMSMRPDGSWQYDKMHKVGYKIIETVYDVNPDNPDDKMIVSEGQVSGLITK